MLNSLLTAVSAGMLLLSGLASGESLDRRALMDLEPTTNSTISSRGSFPSKEMEEQFAAYLKWTKERGLSRLAVYESDPARLLEAAAEGSSATGRFPTREMEEQFLAYVEWIDEQGHGAFYAFQVTDFD